MENIILYVEEYEGAKNLVKDGINFKDSQIIKILIDGYEIDNNNGFEDSLIYFDELEKSFEQSGNYLIFTCACGIADDGGWEGVLVKVSDSKITWTIEVGDSILNFSFDKEQYISEVLSVKKHLESNSLLTLEPCSVTFPEHFSR
jgi:hypothetical protein